MRPVQPVNIHHPSVVVFFDVCGIYLNVGAFSCFLFQNFIFLFLYLFTLPRFTLIVSPLLYVADIVRWQRCDYSEYMIIVVSFISARNLGSVTAHILVWGQHLHLLKEKSWSEIDINSTSLACSMARAKVYEYEVSFIDSKGRTRMVGQSFSFHHTERL